MDVKVIPFLLFCVPSFRQPVWLGHSHAGYTAAFPPTAQRENQVRQKRWRGGMGLAERRALSFLSLSSRLGWTARKANHIHHACHIFPLFLRL